MFRELDLKKYFGAQNLISTSASLYKYISKYHYDTLL